jgi:hypothetical protein
MESTAGRTQGYRNEAKKYAELANSGAGDITTNFVHAAHYIWMAEDSERRENTTHILVALVGRQE